MAGAGENPLPAVIARIHIDGREWQADLGAGRSIAIPLHFHGPQPNSYDVPPATAEAYEDGGFIGDTRRGGSCNFDRISFIPHCNGTHTECVGHITDERLSVEGLLAPGLLAATLISVETPRATESEEMYDPGVNEDDRFITAACIRDALQSQGLPISAAANGTHARRGPLHPFLEALVIRTLPNGTAKRSRRYMRQPAAFFSIDAMRLVRALGVRHLLVDVPSLDRAFDEGKMVAHHIYWDVAFGSHEIETGQPSPRSVTEMIFVPDDVADGPWLLDIQIAPFSADAAPSRPVLFPVTEIRS